MTQMTATLLGKAQAGAHQLTIRAFERQDATSPVVVVLPAMGVPARYYDPFIRLLHERGNTVVSFDVRGQGQSTPRPSPRIRFGYRELVDDLDTVLDLVDSAYPQAPHFLLGHSLGGQLALLYAASRPARLSGVVLLAAGSVWFRSFRGRHAVRTLLGPQLIAVLARLIRYWPGHRFGFGGRQPVGVIRDWARQSRTGRFHLAGTSTDFDAALRELTLPVLAVSMADDELAPSTAVDDLSGRARQSVRTRRHYTRANAGAARLGHFSWVRSAETLSRWVAEWITAQHAPGQRMPEVSGLAHGQRSSVNQHV